MKKRFVIVFIAVLCLLGFIGCSSSEAEKVLAIGMKQNPDVVNYEVGMPLDITGAKVAVVYDNEPTEVVVFDLTKEMVNENSYDIHVPGTKEVEVIYVFGSKEYSTSFFVEYAEKGFKTKAINEINEYKQSTKYSDNGLEVVEAIKSLAVVNIKLSGNEAEVKSVVAKAKIKIDEVPTKAEETLLAQPSASLVKAQANAIKEIENYCLKDKNGNVIVYPELYAQIISANRVIGKADVNAATSVEEVQIALVTAKANIDNAVLGNKTLDEINSSKVAADAAASVATTQAGIAAQKAAEAAQAKEDSVAAKKAAEAAQVKAESAQAKAEAAQKAAEAAKKAAEDIQKDVNASKIEIAKAQKAAEEAKKAAEAAKDAAVKAQQAAETAQAKAEAAQSAAELAQSKAETAQAKAEAAQQAAEEAKKAAADILEEIKGIYNQIPEAAAAIAEVNGYVADDNYAGIYKLLVQNTKTSYVAAIKMAKTAAEVNELVAGAKAALDQIADKNSTGAAQDAEAALELEAAKLSAKAEFAAYVDILDFQKPDGAPFPGEVDEYPENPDQQALLDAINALIAETEAEIEAAKTVSEVNVALAKGMGQAKLETIYVDFYSSWLVQELGILFRSEYQPYELSYSKENYDKLLQIMDFYVTYIGRIDKIDELNKKFEQAKEELDAIKTQSEEIIDMIAAVQKPILIGIDGSFDSYDEELKPILDKLAEFNVSFDQATGTFFGPNDRCANELNIALMSLKATEAPGAKLKNYLDRYDELVAAKAEAETPVTGVIALTEALPAKYDIMYVDHAQQVKDAKAEYDAWIAKYFYGEYSIEEANNPLYYEKEKLNTRLVSNYAKLAEAVARVEQLEAAQAAAPAVIDTINAILGDNSFGYVSINPDHKDEEQFANAEQAYCDWMQEYEIADNTKNADFVTNRALLAEVKARLEVLNNAKAEAEKENDGVIALIDAVLADGLDYVTLSDETQISDARTAYDAWLAQYVIADEDENDKYIMGEKDDTLVKYEERYAELVAAKAEAETPVTGVIALTEALPAKYDIMYVDHAQQVKDAKAEYDAWIAKYFYGEYSIEEANNPLYYEKEKLNTRLVSNYAKLAEAVARVEQLEAAQAAAPAVIDTINAILGDNSFGYVSINPDHKDEEQFANAEQAYCDWMQEYEIADNTKNADFVTNRALLAEVKARLEVLNNAKAEAEKENDGVIALIDAVLADGLDYVTLSDETQISDARTAYDAWLAQYVIADEDENDKYIMGEKDDTLVKYEARYAELVAAQAAAPAVDALIDAVIPTGKVTLDDKDALEAAEEAYDKWLTDYAIDPEAEPINADMVTGREDLAQYRVEYDALVVKLAEVEEAIDLIGEVTANSEDAIIAAEKAYLELVAQNNGVEASHHVDGYADLLAARASYEALLYGEARNAAYAFVGEKINQITAQMGPSRSIDERLHVKSVGTLAQEQILSNVPAPVAPSPYVHGAWTDQREAYNDAFDQLHDAAYDAIYVAAIYLVYGDATAGYEAHIYASGTYNKFTTKEGEIIKAVKDLYIDALVGTGHVELQGLSVSGTIYINGGGSSSVVFTDCTVNDIKVNYAGVRVVLNSDAHLNGVLVLGNELETSDTVIVELNNAELKEVEVYCNVKFEGTKAGETNIAVKAEVALDVPAAVLANSTLVKDEAVEEYEMNDAKVDSEKLEVAEDGAYTVSAPAIELDDNETTGNLEYVIEGVSIVFGGEGQKLAYNNGYKLGVKITAPALVSDYSKVVVTVNGEVVEVEVLEGGYFNYVFEVKEVPAELVIEVVWAENIAKLQYVASVAEGTVLDITSGEFTEDDAKVAGEEALVEVKDTVITVDGVLKYYAANELEEGAEAGYYVGYKLVPDAATGFETETKVIKVTPELVKAGYSFEKQYNETTKFVYEIKFAETVKFETVTTVEKFGDDYVETEVAVEENVITVSGKVPYILADESLGRAAGYRVGLAIQLAKGLALQPKLVKVDGVEIELEAELASNDGVLYYFVPVVPEKAEYTFEVKWNEYGKAAYTLVIAEDAEFEVPAAEEVKLEGKAEAKVGEVVEFKAQVLPIYASQEITWEVSDDTVATIANGKLTAKYPGTVTVKAIVNEEIKAEIEVVVTDYTIAEIVEMTPATTATADKVAVGFDGVIVALQYKGYWVADETGLVLIYTGSTKYPEVGKYVYINGKVTTYQPELKFTCQISDSSYTVLEGEAPKYDLPAAEYELIESYEKGIDTLAKAKESGYYGKVLKVKGTISGSGNYWYISDAEGHRFYISNAYTTSAFVGKAGHVTELELLVREIYFKKDSSNYNNYDASMFGGFYLGTPVVYPNDLTVDASVEEGATFVENGLTYIEGVNIFATIQEAVDAAEEGQTINVKAGLYQAAVSINKSVTIVGANKGLELVHTDEFDSEAETNTIIKGTITIEAETTNVKLEGFVSKGQIVLNGAEGVTIESVVVTLDSTADINYNGMIYLATGTTNKNVVIEKLYSEGTSDPRVIYVKGNVENLTINNCATLDNASGIYDYARISSGTEARALGTVTFTNNYVGPNLQSGFMDRFPNADKYIIENNYFEEIPAAIYFRSATLKNTAIEYSVKYNTFVGCGSRAADWDVIAITNGADSKVAVNDNAFINCLTDEKKYTDYVIKVRNATGTIDCANNYFDAATAENGNLNATGFTTMDVAESITVPYECDLYKVVVVDEKAYVFGVNAEYKKPTVEVLSATISFSNLENRVSQDANSQVWTQNGVTLTNNKASSSNSVANYSNPVRCYKGSDIIIEYGKEISKLVITFSAKSYALQTGDEVAGGTLTVNSNTVSTIVLDPHSTLFTLSNLPRQLRITKIEVYVME